MRKIISFVCVALGLVLMTIIPNLIKVEESCVWAENKSHQFAINKEDSEIETEISDIIKDFIQYGQQVRTRLYRVPGSEAEKESALYIHGVMSSLANFKPVNNQSTINGIQTFGFKNLYDNKTYASQNIIFKRESKVETDKKVILSTHYDSAYVFPDDYEKSVVEENNKLPQSVVAEGISDNAGSVATLLALVKHLDSLDVDPGFDIEVIFFGASSNDYAGSRYYNRGIYDKQVKDTLLVLNLDKISLGAHTYIYVNEFETSQERYILELLNKDLSFKKLNSISTLDFSGNSPNGLDYTHFGLESDHAVFMNRNVNVLNFFSGNYEKFCTFGYQEYDSKENITYSKNDNLDYILSVHPEFIQNLTEVYRGVNTLLWEQNFATEMQKDNGAKEWYGFWNNDKIAVAITIGLFAVSLIIYLVIFARLNKKSQKSIEESNINQVVLKIATNLGEKDKEIQEIIDQKVKDDTHKHDAEKPEDADINNN